MRRTMILGALGALALLPSAKLGLSSAKLDQVGELIEKGRQALESGKPVDAQKLFDQAAEKDKNSLRTRTWVLRSWMDQGRINDSLDAIDALSKGGAKGPEIDYLYGMAFSQKARGYLSSGVANGPIQMSLEDAVQFLEKATKADPELARDAFVPLAEAAWYCQKLDVARTAAEAGVKRAPKDGDAQFMLGQVAFSQYVSAKHEPAKKGEADAAWEAAKAAFSRAAEVFAAPKDAETADKLARAELNLGHAYGFKDQWPEAQAAYAAAVVARPAAVDLTQVQRVLGSERFLATVEAALPKLSADEKANPADVAALTWWVGWARLDQKQYEKAEEALAAAVAKKPEFINAWYFLAVAREGKKDMEGALAALRKYADANAEDLGVMLLKDPDTSVKVIDALIAFCAEKQRSADAAFLSELECELYPNESRYWNNTGLFWRDAGELLQKGTEPDAKQKAAPLFEKSWKAYSKALELEPENPALLNDAAVILHYYLDRDLDKARAMYKKAAERAKAELAKPDLSKELRDLYETALRDSTNNLAKLEKGEKSDKG